MQGQRGAVGSLPDTLGLPMSSNDSTLDQQIFWNNMNNSANTILPDYMGPPTAPHGNSMSLGGWSSSSSLPSPFNGDRPLLGLPQFEPVPGLPSFAESSNSRRDININLEAENVDEDSQIVQQHPNRKRKANEGQSSNGGLTISENNSVFPSEHISPRLSLTIGAASEAPLSSGGNTDNSRRNLRARTNSLRRQNEIANANSSSNNGPQTQQLARLISLNNGASSESGLPTDPTISRRRAAVGPRRTPMMSSRWNRGSSSRNHVNPPPIFAVASSGPGELIAAPNPTNLNLLGGNLNGSTSRSADPLWFANQYPQRLDILRRSLIAASEMAPRGSTNLQETQIPRGVGEVALPQSRQVDGAFGLPYSLRTPAVAAASANARRSRIMSEIRNALDQMRRGDGLRPEDVMVLEQSMFFRMADAHRDMRLDVDNMSYEELLALEDRIGYVSTGLTEEAITSQLKKRKYFTIAMGSQTEFEPCCICQEEYSDGKDIGTLDCGHEFHAGCIKQWLTQKNLCPICKATGLNNTNNNNSS
ncbi:probable E3 ubiquitin-protein ligase RHG1A [Impatiens glandulifera]|uniref:probable E3 ubiquitin-protein ligase RHG1A n=1 Tax=Impatiens glandulifera TaxID=253017 RepID=UPI001FB06295|nr:probable E3 ubiquitin-protein ligase RHG1A [Impatiens glandulifera]